ncbi:Ig-like domain-containing protein [Sphingobacterium humi]|uniref:Uncharacterized protein n=1 Tax=Sphingobacterium humi TaxID=1796905 RepID=A0A6N8KZQ8_9SPHI|nr:Ig-like domain-containing protein [Sphingobacterium humi]MVZ62960.1 hypothetical protein [Sphingobacterium humi]
MKIYKSCYILFLLLLFLALFGCKKDKSNPVDSIINPPLLKGIALEGTYATLKGEAESGAEVTIQYEGEQGIIIKKLQVDNNGQFSVDIDRLVDYEQLLTAFCSKNNQHSERVSFGKIMAKAPFAAGWKIAKELISAHPWKSDQSRSRVIIKQSAGAPPYDMFATVAQKYFRFQWDGSLQFRITNPVAFEHLTGNWQMNDTGALTINTAIPLGPLHLKNVKIQHANASRLELLAQFADGLFLLSFQAHE